MKTITVVLSSSENPNYLSNTPLDRTEEVVGAMTNFLDNKPYVYYGPVRDVQSVSFNENTHFAIVGNSYVSSEKISKMQTRINDILKKQSSVMIVSSNVLFVKILKKSDAENIIKL